MVMDAKVIIAVGGAGALAGFYIARSWNRFTPGSCVAPGPAARERCGFFRRLSSVFYKAFAQISLRRAPAWGACPSLQQVRPDIIPSRRTHFGSLASSSRSRKSLPSAAQLCQDMP